jgi:G protein-coupled receptor Mth (Methuselah protein)
MKIKFRAYATLLAISAAFLGATFLVYILLPNLLNLHGKTTVCHVFSLFVSYTFLSVVQFHTDYELSHCKLIGEFGSSARQFGIE